MTTWPLGPVGLPHSLQLSRRCLPRDVGEEPSPTSLQQQEAAGSAPPVTWQHPPHAAALSTRPRRTQHQHRSLRDRVLTVTAGCQRCECLNSPVPPGHRALACPEPPRGGQGPLAAGAGGTAADCYFRRRD